MSGEALAHPEDAPPHDKGAEYRADANAVDAVQKEKRKVKREKSEVGAYEGAGYSLKGVYRPYRACRIFMERNPEYTDYEEVKQLILKAGSVKKAEELQKSKRDLDI